ncbi:hypothetical protein ACOMHN_019095 [Nucella lapillus]
MHPVTTMQPSACSAGTKLWTGGVMAECRPTVLLKLCAEKGQRWRRRHRQEEKDIIQRKLFLEQNYQSKEDQKAALLQRKYDMISALQEQEVPAEYQQQGVF